MDKGAWRRLDNDFALLVAVVPSLCPGAGRTPVLLRPIEKLRYVSEWRIYTNERLNVQKILRAENIHVFCAYFLPIKRTFIPKKTTRQL